MRTTVTVPAGSVRLIAHRGLSALERENTAAAFVAAGNRACYYGIETDVHRTADGKFIIIHDDDTGRVAASTLPVEETRYAMLRRLELLDMSGRHSRADLRLPSLGEYSGICRDYGKVSVLELKNHFLPEDIARIVDIIRKEGWLEETVFISFDLLNLVTLRRLLPDARLQYLTMDMGPAVRKTLRHFKLDLDVYYRAVTREGVEALHRQGTLINCWTVDTAEDYERLSCLGVDMMTTNVLESV